MIKRIKYEKYKIYEFSRHSELRLIKEEYSHAFIFFAGFNEFASKYIYLFKSFFEKMENCNIKIIIPNIPILTRENTSSLISNEFQDTTISVNSWFYHISDKNNEGTKADKTVNKAIINSEIREYIVQLINKEIKILGGEDKIIFGGFSQGGQYLINFILDYTRIKSCFNIIFKSPLDQYKLAEIKNDKDKIFMDNFFFLFYSRLEKVVPFHYGIRTYQSLSSQFENVYVKFDNGKHHVLDNECLEYFEEVLNSFLKNKTLVKF